MNPVRVLRLGGGVSALSLLASTSTLICCALPALLVALGAGSVLAGLVSFAPRLVWLSEHKGLVFGLAAGCLVAAGAMQVFARRLPCPINLELAAQCQRSRRLSYRLYFGSVAVFAMGALFAFGL
jgi:hypothetical protein